jgi:hypothetical protein
MFTLFWAGDVFAPNHRFDGQSIQQILQSSFINSFKHLAERLQDLKNVIGFEVMVKKKMGRGEWECCRTLPYLFTKCLFYLFICRMNLILDILGYQH